MRSLGLLALCLTITCARVSAQDPAADPRAGTLIDCGAEKVAIFANTTSKDGRYALGWTVRPNRKKDPVDWSIYRSDDTRAFHEKHIFESEEGEMESQDYLMVDGVLDLKEKKFVPLDSRNPYFPGRNHWGISAFWSQNLRGGQYGITTIDARFSTFEVWLLTINAKGVKTRNLTPQVDLAMRSYLRQRDPQEYQDYALIYSQSTEEAKGSVFNAKAGSVKIRFDAGIGKDSRKANVGYITISMPRGTVTSVNKK